MGAAPALPGAKFHARSGPEQAARTRSESALRIDRIDRRARFPDAVNQKTIEVARLEAVLIEVGTQPCEQRIDAGIGHFADQAEEEIQRAVAIPERLEAVLDRVAIGRFQDSQRMAGF